jgi:hypothetical protein
MGDGLGVLIVGDLKGVDQSTLVHFRRDPGIRRFDG